MQLQAYAIDFVRGRPLYSAILLFLLLFLSVVTISPSVVFDQKGRALPFGIGLTKRTVTPMWLVTLIIAFTSYALTLYASRVL